ncbi:uroporphyrinogen decarboxylase family protein [Pseudogracilibacillus sp. SO30301A]|uniref:uroporphyrinogen decarboxylase family protein n=1 Tax=Pseudogracilibacillus sp. SO30301A TaxID=3098291 RepID=UPI00300DC78E
MKAIERIQNMIEGKEVDRPGVSFWKHFPLVDRKVDKMIKTTIDFQLQFQSDFVKLSHNGLYSTEDWGNIIKWPSRETEVGQVTEFVIKEAEDWKRLEVNKPNTGALLREVLITEGVLERFKGNVPVLSTIFSPLTTAIKLCGEETLLRHINEEPDLLRKGLKTITETTILFLRKLSEKGIDGIFFASQLATFDRLTSEQYDVFGKRYDEIVLQELTGNTWFNIVHIHGKEPMIEKLEAYPVQALNWHDRIANVTLKDARKLTDKILIGGIEENYDLENVNEHTLQSRLEDAVTQVGDLSKLILGPGCVMPLTATNERFALTKSIVNKLEGFRVPQVEA